MGKVLRGKTDEAENPWEAIEFCFEKGWTGEEQEEAVLLEKKLP